MSWVEKLKNGLEITTGDGIKFFPLYRLNPKTTGFNVAEFEFPNIEGTLVKRSLVKGIRCVLEFFFQGDDHLDQSLAFETSAKDKRPWIVLHPFFGKLTLQPTTLEYDPTGLNITKITGDFIETISDEFPRIVQDPTNKISFDFGNTTASLVDSFAANVIPDAGDIVLMTENNNDVFALGSESVKSGDQANEYFQLFNKANAAVLNAAAEISIAAQLIIDLYVFPSLFVAGIKSRLSLLFSQLESIGTGLENLLTFNEKTIYEMNGAAIVSAMVNASIMPDDDDYGSATAVLETIDDVLLGYDTFLTNLASLQTITNDDIDSYIPDFDSITALTDLVNFGTANLLLIALEAKSERSIILENDSNPLLLSHRFYGSTDENPELTLFIDQNQIGINEMLEIKKGKKILYYI